MESLTPTLFTARNIMTTEIVSVGPDATISEVADLLETYRVSGLPVVDTENRIIGVITEYDLLQSISKLQMSGLVADFMTTDVTSIDQDATLSEISQVFAATRVRRVPVTSSDGKLVGVVSRRDLIFAGNIRQQLLADLPTTEFMASPTARSSDGSA